MLCPFCQAVVAEDAIVCPECKRTLPRGNQETSSIENIRQGRRAREAASSTADKTADPMTPLEDRRQGQKKFYTDASFRPEDLHQGKQRASGAEQPSAKAEEDQPHTDDTTPLEPVWRDPVKRRVYDDTMPPPVFPHQPTRKQSSQVVMRRAVNWVYVGIGTVAAIIVFLFGTLLFLNRTDEGQRILIRMGRDGTAIALWEVGEECLNRGDIDKSIELFLRAREKDGEENINVPGLLMLGSAYEAAGLLVSAEELYTEIYSDIVPSAPDAYTNNIRILRSQGREAEAAALMAEAYEATGNTIFRTQRRELLPFAPEVNKAAGTYDHAISLELSSPDGMDVYYTFDELASLPAEGVLYTSPIYTDEGNWKLRAVAVNGDLVSDELTGVYRVVMPSPGTPSCNLAPNTYKKRQSVHLRKNAENAKDEDITIYYTIDGSLPNEDSPIYDGTAISLPGGTVTLQAVAVNKYGKASNTFSRTFKFEQKPYPKSAYSSEDTANGVVLYTTTFEQFTAKYGDPKSNEEVEIAAYHDVGHRYHYSWGYADFYREKGVQHLVRLYFTGTLTGPRGTAVGDLEKDVVEVFRDMGQVTSPSGNRGLYAIVNSSGNVNATGYIYADVEGQRVVRYLCQTADSHTWQLDYIESPSGVVRAIDMLYLP